MNNEFKKIILKLDETNNTNDINGYLLNACEIGNLNIVDFLLSSEEIKNHANIHTDDDDAIRLAARRGDLNIIQYLLTSPKIDEHINIYTQNNTVFRRACRFDHLDIVKYLLTSPELNNHSDPSDGSQEDNEGLIWAGENGCINVVRYLLEDSTLNYKPSQDALQRLLKSSFNAFKNGKIEVAQYCIFDLNIPFTKFIKTFLNNNPNTDIKKQFENMFKVRELNENLNQTLVNSNQNKKSLKL